MEAVSGDLSLDNFPTSIRIWEEKNLKLPAHSFLPFSKETQPSASIDTKSSKWSKQLFQRMASSSALITNPWFTLFVL